MKGTQLEKFQRQLTNTTTRISLSVFSTLGLFILTACAPEDTRMSVYEYLAMHEDRCAAPAGPLATTQPAQTQPIELPAWSPGPYRIGPGDIVEIQISGLEAIGMEGIHRVRVNQNGEARLPTVGEIQVAGLTMEELEEKVRNVYVPKYIQETQISARIAESELGEKLYHTVNVTVMGAVATPSTVQLRRDSSSILQAVMSAGGPSEFASGRITWIPASNPSAAKQFDLCNRSELVHAAKIGRLSPSDVIIVERRTNNFVYVQGLVNTPGPIPLGPSGDLTAMQAIASGGGSLLAFTPKEATLYRTRDDGEIMRVRLDLQRMRAGKDPDIVLQPGDILSVPHTFETRMEEFLAKAFIFRFGMDTTFNPWTHYYFQKDFEIQQERGGNEGFFGTFGRSLITQDLTPLWTSPSSSAP